MRAKLSSSRTPVLEGPARLHAPSKRTPLIIRIPRVFYFSSLCISWIVKRAAAAITARVPARQSNTMSIAEQRALRQSWNAALDAAHFGSLESMESTSANSLRRSSSWKDKMYACLLLDKGKSSDLLSSAPF